MARRSRRGFTLVEVLVVITILAMLMALLVPAALGVAAMGRRAQCANNLKELGMACMKYESKHGYFPPLLTRSKLTPPGFVLSWVFPLLGDLDKGDLNAMYLAGYLAFPASAGGNPGEDANQQLANATFMRSYLSNLVCPSDPPDSLVLPWLSYVVNGGMPDLLSPNPPYLDFRENGVFHVENLQPVPLNTSLPPPERVSAAYVSSHDGLKSTVLLTENVILNREISNNPRVWFRTPSLGNIVDFNIGVHWYVDESIAYPNEWIDEPFNGVRTGTWRPDKWVSRPSSRHGGGYHVAWADGSVNFLSDQMDKFIFRLLLTPYGRAARNTSGASFAPQFRAVSEAELAR